MRSVTRYNVQSLVESARVVPALCWLPRCKGELAVSMRICVIDDNELIRDALALVLADAGHEVRFAATGADGISIAESGWLDAVVVDYDLPDMKGDDVAATMRALAPTAAIVLASGWYSPEAKRDGDFDLFLQKPFTPRSLIAAVETALARRSAVV